MDEDEVVSLHDNTMDHNGGVTSPEDQIAIAAALDFDDPVATVAQPVSAALGSSNNAGVSIASDFLSAGPSGSNPINRTAPNREIKFTVTHATTGASLQTSLAECETVETLKTLIHAQ